MEEGNKTIIHLSSRPASGEGANLPSKQEPLSDKHRIGFLNQCKLELSAEVIRWKEESVKMQKENESALKQIEELQSFANKLARKNHDLETSLFLSWEENKRLRMRTLAIGEENSVLHDKLSKSKYYSYPWIEFRNSTSSRDESGTQSSPATETWEDVSRKLFQQMQKEMQEMHKLNQALAGQSKTVESSEPKLSTSPKLKEDIPDVDFVEEKLDNLTVETNSLKRHLEVQNEKLHFLLNCLSQDAEKQHKSVRATSILTDPQVSNREDSVKTKTKQYPQPLDETFRAYFTQQLCKGSADDRKTSQVYVNRDNFVSGHDCTKRSDKLFEKASDQKVTAPVIKPAMAETAAKPEEVKVCPICEKVFGKSVSDKEFEAHVIANLDAHCNSD